ncbi:MAG: hypothetical protein J2P22_15130 [Nocardioides sp.]|nr:hypothetical protein [Nocardioides sp.]
MTLQEIFQRIIRAHLLLICTCALLPVLLVAGLARGQSAPWTGSVRIQVNSSAPASTTEADALSSRVLALATTPTLVAKALDQANIKANPSDIAQHHVTATRLGESPVVDVSVTLPSRTAAGALARTLVEQVVAFMNKGSRPALDDRISALDKQITQADEERTSLINEANSANRRILRILQIRIQSVENNLTQLQAERSTLLDTKLGTDEAVVIDGDNPGVVRAGSTLVPRAALGLVLGLLMGLAIAVLVETISPRVAGVRALARTLSAPVLGRTDESPADVAASVRLAARRQGIKTVVVMAVEEKEAPAATTLLASLPAPVRRENRPPARSAIAPLRNGQRPQQSTDPFQTVEVNFSSLAALPASAERTAGVLVVSTGTCRVRDLDHLRDRLTALRWPVVGIIELTRSTLRHSAERSRQSEDEASSGPAVPLDDLVQTESSDTSDAAGKHGPR